MASSNFIGEVLTDTWKVGATAVGLAPRITQEEKLRSLR